MLNRSERRHRRPALFENEATQRRVIAVCMLVLLGAAMSAAQWLTTRRAQARDAQIILQPINAFGLNLAAPAMWVQDDAAKPLAEQITGTRAVAVLVDPDRPTRTLSIGRLPINSRPDEVMQMLIDRLQAVQDARFEQVQATYTFRRTTTFGLGVTGLTEDEDGTYTQHALAVLTATGRTHWVLYLREGPLNEDTMSMRVAANEQLLRELIATTEIQSGSIG